MKICVGYKPLGDLVSEIVRHFACELVCGFCVSVLFASKPLTTELRKQKNGRF